MGSTSKSMHRKVQIKHDLMTRKCKSVCSTSLCSNWNSKGIVHLTKTVTLPYVVSKLY